MAAHLIYLANARLPTEKAHGHAIVKMCEAYAREGARVELWHPRRQQGDARLSAMSVFEFYDVPRTFRVRTLKNLDVIPAERWLPKPFHRALVGVHDFAWARYAAHLVKRDRPTLCHTRDAGIAFWTARANTPTILEVHDPPAGPRRGLVRRTAERTSLRGVVALTEGSRASLEALGVPRSKIIVLGSAVDTEPYERLPSRAECRREHGLPLDRPIIGYIGRFRTMGLEKGLTTLVKAAAMLEAARTEEALLLCVGGPMDEVSGYLRIAHEYGGRVDDFRFVDRVPSSEIPSWIRACDIGVVPSPGTRRFAQFASPMKLFEFMAGGVPMVVTDLPALSDTLTHGRNSWLVPPDDPKALADGLAHLLSDPELRNRLADQAKQDVGRHTWRARAATLLANYAGA
ncbi:MAG TPA: glycosyltransferase family 4 protein [Acidimicrobiia bacterium]